MLHLILAVLLAILGRAVFVYFFPCSRDGRRRLGAGLVHKVKLAIGQAWAEREWWR